MCPIAGTSQWPIDVRITWYSLDLADNRSAASPTMALWLFLWRMVLACGFFSTRGVHPFQTTLSPFHVVKSADGDVPVCACYNSESFKFLIMISALGCVAACQSLRNGVSDSAVCVGANYQEKDRSCYLYDGSGPSAFVTRPGCRYYQVRNIRDHTILITRCSTELRAHQFVELCETLPSALQSNRNRYPLLAMTCYEKFYTPTHLLAPPTRTRLV